MDRLTSTEIKNFNDVNAFALSRSNARLPNVTQQPESNNVTSALQTSSVEESFSLVQGLSSRLTTIKENLVTMLELAQEGTSRNNTISKQQELFGKLRSLTAGVDQVVEATTFDGQSFMQGSRLRLLDGQSSISKTVYDSPNFLTYGEDSLDLSRKEEGAETTIFYKPATLAFNQSSDLLGLDISEAQPSEIALGELELENGDYELEFVYEGADSTIIMRDINGIERLRKTGVDLSGTGQEIVDMGVGFKLSIEKENILTGDLDKYDFETLGPVSLKADLEYNRNFQHKLSSGATDEVLNTSVETLSSISAVDGSNSLNLINLDLTPVSPGLSELDTGSYTIVAKYKGENTQIELRDVSGALMALQLVDSGESGNDRVNFGNGVSFDLQNIDFTKEGGQASLTFAYERSTNNAESFDFKAFEKKVVEANALLDAQLAQVQAIEDEIIEIEQTKNAAIEQANQGVSSSVLAASSINSLLASVIPSTTSSLFNPTAASAQLQVVGTELFTNTAALSEAQLSARYSSFTALEEAL